MGFNWKMMLDDLMLGHSGLVTEQEKYDWFGVGTFYKDDAGGVVGGNPVDKSLNNTGVQNAIKAQQQKNGLSLLMLIVGVFFVLKILK